MLFNAGGTLITSVTFEDPGAETALFTNDHTIQIKIRFMSKPFKWLNYFVYTSKAIAIPLRESPPRLGFVPSPLGLDT